MRHLLRRSLVLIGIISSLITPLYQQSQQQATVADYSSCPNGLFAIPHAGEVGWLYEDPIAHTGIPDDDGPGPNEAVPPDWDYSSATKPPYEPVISHTGIDIRGAANDPVVAVYDGKVTRPLDKVANPKPRVVIDHSEYGLPGVETYYTHLYSVTVQTGEEVKKGDVIGYLEPIGYPHLHFSVKQPGKDESHLPFTFDPSRYFNANLKFRNEADRYAKTILEWCNEETEHLSIALIIDSSGSMIEHDPTNLRKNAAEYFVKLARPGDRIAIIDFDNGARTWALPTTISIENEARDKQVLLDAIARVDSAGGTNVGAGLAEGYRNLESDATNSVKAAIFLTDGQDDTRGIYRDQHELYQQKRWPVYSIGLGSDVDADQLQLIAEKTGGLNPATNRFYSAPNNETLQEIYRQL